MKTCMHTKSRPAWLVERLRYLSAQATYIPKNAPI
jgi:hypothetical protein